MKAIRVRGGKEPVAVGKIICVGANYKRHIKEMGRKEEGEPLLFFKPPGALVWDGGQIPYPAFTKMLHHELEMVLLIGRPGSNITAGKAGEHVAGVAVGLDLTARDRQLDDMKKGRPWAVSKGFDFSAPVSDFITVCEDLDLDKLEMTLRVNGETRQHGNTGDMLRSTDELVATISRYFALDAGDLVFTGTPEGVGPLVPGDKLEVELGGLVSANFTVSGSSQEL